MLRRVTGLFSSAVERKRARQLQRTKEQLHRAKQALNFFAQQEFASTAARYLEDGKRLTEHPHIDALISDGMLQQHAFSQKSPRMMQFYRQLIRGLPRPPERILEIGVKNGGSLALWRALFPRATIVGIDLGVPKVTHEGIVYLIGDQSDAERMKQIGGEYGPFDIVIDDGSHVGEHQLITLQALWPHVASGAIYVIEDVHVAIKPDQSQYGADVWPEFLSMAFTCLRKRPADIGAASPPAQLAFDLAPRIQDVTIAYHTLAFRIRDNPKPTPTP
jgi:predicted O-methyltransferase YrrM